MVPAMGTLAAHLRSPLPALALLLLPLACATEANSPPPASAPAKVRPAGPRVLAAAKAPFTLAGLRRVATVGGFTGRIVSLKKAQLAKLSKAEAALFARAVARCTPAEGSSVVTSPCWNAIVELTAPDGRRWPFLVVPTAIRFDSVAPYAPSLFPEGRRAGAPRARDCFLHEEDTSPLDRVLTERLGKPTAKECRGTVGDLLGL